MFKETGIAFTGIARRLSGNKVRRPRHIRSSTTVRESSLRSEIRLAPTRPVRYKARSFSGTAAMKKEIHPDYHEINIVMTDGSSFQTRSTYGKAGDTLRLDIDPKSHPAWTGVQKLLDTGGQIAKFNKRFGSFGLKK